MIEVLALVCLTEALAFAGAFFFAQRDRAHERTGWAKEKERLLDRVMAKDLSEYKTYGERPPAPPIPQVIDDEDEARYASRVSTYPERREDEAA